MRTFCNRNTFYNRYRHKKVRIFGKFAFILFLCMMVRFLIVNVCCCLFLQIYYPIIIVPTFSCNCSPGSPNFTLFLYLCAAAGRGNGLC